MTDTNTGAPTASTSAPAKPKTTKELQAELKAAIADLQPNSAPAKSDHEVVRDQRFATIEARLANFADEIVELSEGTTELESLVGITKSLKTIQHRARKAIYGVPDSAIPLNAPTGPGY